MTIGFVATSDQSHSSSTFRGPGLVVFGIWLMPWWLTLNPLPINDGVRAAIANGQKPTLRLPG
jgi:hypothetical protein